MRISPSTLQLFMDCPLQVKFKKILRLPTRQNGKASFGTVIHAALEHYNTYGNVDAARLFFLDNWNNPEKLGVTPDYWPKYTSYTGLKAKGIEIIQEYHNTQRWDSRTIIATEHHFLVPFGDHELEGIVDLLELKKAGNGKLTLRVIDYKTASRQPYLPELRLNVQFTTYILASLQPEFWMGNGPNFPGITDGERWFKDLQKVSRVGIWHHLMTMKELNAGTRDDGDFMRLYRLVTEIDKAMKADIYIPSIKADACVFCDFTKECGITIPDRDDASAEVL